jgi:hypothetical protein
MFMARRFPIDPSVSAFSYQMSASGENCRMISSNAVPIGSLRTYHADDEDLGTDLRAFIDDLLYYDGRIVYRLVPLNFLGHWVSSHYSCTGQDIGNGVETHLEVTKN